MTDDMKNRQKKISEIAFSCFYLAVIIEVLLVIIDKSAYVNPLEGTLFRLTFVLCLVKAVLTKYSWKEYTVLALLLGMGIISYYVTDKNDIIRITVFLAACKEINMKKCMKLVFVLTLAGCVSIIFLSLMGIGGTISVVQDYGRGAVETRYTLGMGHPNALQCMVWALTALGLYLFADKINWILYVVIFGINVFFFSLTNSKTGLLAGIFTILCFFTASHIKKTLTARLFSAGNICVCMLSIIGSVVIAKDAMCLWNYYVEGIYDRKVEFYIPLDGFLTGRIGSLIETRGHEGVMDTWSLFGREGNHSYYFDMGWVRLFYWYGVIPALVAIVILFVLLFYFYRKRKLLEIVMISAFSLYSVIEAHAVSVYLARNYVLFIVGMYWWRLFASERNIQSSEV